MLRGAKNWTQTFFLKLFGHRRDIPAKSRDIPPKKFDFPGFEGHTGLFGPHPSTWKTPTPPENIRTKKFGFGFLFLPWEYALQSQIPHRKSLSPSGMSLLHSTCLEVPALRKHLHGALNCRRSWTLGARGYYGKSQHCSNFEIAGREIKQHTPWHETNT